MKKKTIKANNAVMPAATASVWGYKGCPGKGGKTLNSTIKNNEAEKESN